MHKFCFRCDKPIENATGFSKNDLEHRHFDAPWQAMVWTSTGNYGSQIYDAYEGEHLEIVICDNCVLENKKRIIEYEVTLGDKYPLLSCPPKSFENVV